MRTLERRSLASVHRTDSHLKSCCSLPHIRSPRHSDSATDPSSASTEQINVLNRELSKAHEMIAHLLIDLSKHEPEILQRPQYAEYAFLPPLPPFNLIFHFIF